MVFKPFKPPLIRKNTEDPNTKSDLSTDTLDKHGPPAKRPRLHQDRTVGSVGPSERKPLVQVRNIGEPVCDNVKDDESAGERHFNVLWYDLITTVFLKRKRKGRGKEQGKEKKLTISRRKPTTKKNKTWDGDGILLVRNGYAHLRDVSGRDMGRVMHTSHLEPGTMLSIGGKEVEVDSEMSKKEYLSGKQFLETKPSPTPPVAPPKKGFVPVSGNKTSTSNVKENQLEKGQMQIIPNPASRKSSSTSSAYKRPLLENTVIPQKSAEEPVPRHDPKQPGALVMKRPASAPKGKRVVDVVVDPILAKHLRPHQREGVKFLYECVMGMRSFNGQGAILADDMGLGKTLQTITLLWTLLKQNPIYENPPEVKKALIVCPVTLINNWRKEFRKWLGNERIGVFVFDDKRKRLTDFTRGRAYNIMIVGYEKLRTVQEGLAQGAGVDIIIADEGHRLKTLQNKSGQAIQSLNATKRVILSGTPIQNDLKEFFAAVDLVNPGVLGTFKAFVREFEGPIVKSRQPEATRRDIEKGEARNEELRELTSQFMLRRTADILASYLPPKSEYILFCDPTPTQANIYQNVLASPVFQCAVGNSESALQLITILKKLCNSPSLLSPRNVDETPSETIAALLSSLPPNLLRHFSPSSSAKIRVLDQLLHILHTSTSEKVVLVSNYTSTLNLLATLLTSLSLPFLRLDGSTPAQKRQSLVEDFNRFPANRCFAFLLSAKAGGTGLNLIGASRLILFDVDWNPATDIQAMARIHRDGQKRHCRIYRILLKGSLEEKIWQRQVTKLGLADSVMEHKDNTAQFSRDELKDLFRLDQDSKCQTHELLGCDCGGRGQNVSTPESRAGSPADGQGNISDVNDSEEVEEDFPDVLTLIEASKLDIEKQDRMIKANSAARPGSRTTKSINSTKSKKQKNKMQQSLSQYCHIDPCHLTTTIDDTQDVQQAIDDDVLFAMLKEEDNRISFVFKKSSTALAKDTDSSMAVVLSD